MIGDAEGDEGDMRIGGRDLEVERDFAFQRAIGARFRYLQPHILRNTQGGCHGYIRRLF